MAMQSLNLRIAQILLCGAPAPSNCMHMYMYMQCSHVHGVSDGNVLSRTLS
jgi:hypothetical protein